MFNPIGHCRSADLAYKIKAAGLHGQFKLLGPHVIIHCIKYFDT